VLFNSYQFLFAFFPAALAFYLLATRFGERAGIAGMLAVSLAFYAFWDVRFLLLLGGSILGNFGIGVLLARAMEREKFRAASLLLAVGVSLDLLVLGIFKYANFAVGNLNGLFQTNIVLGQIILPLGISFFTFEQISYLTDIRRGRKYDRDLLSYSVFVSFFPRLVAGPILRYGEIQPQLGDKRRTETIAQDFTVGLTMFVLGLTKKVVLADGVSPFVHPLFDSAAAGASPEFFAAWMGALAYTCQLYFDFSGYSDMAIGAARCFGIRFPQNFNSPYKAASIVEFWRRWHMTLSRFLRDYLYISLGGNRKGPVRRYVNLMLTMLLGGLWHGANWTFVAWGGLHGFYLIVNHFFDSLRESNGTLDRLFATRLGRLLSISITFLAVVVAWVFFRAPTFAAAAAIIGGMTGLHGAHLPSGFVFALKPIQPVLDMLAIGYGNESGSNFVQGWAWIIALLAICFTLPNTQQLMRYYEPALDFRDTRDGGVRWSWSPNMRWAAASGALCFVAVASITRVSEFLYWQF
jgi:D-alanyl-lipoteichoic acid acyltransferase DltB (MBOAT superfamily)